MKGITFGNVHSFRDLDLILTRKEIGSPNIKTKKIDIEGADGALDLTDFFGEPTFENVLHKFTFTVARPQSEFLTAFSDVKNAVHGWNGRIILDDDPSFFYVGRCSVSGFTNEKNIGEIEIEADCEPWKYKSEETQVYHAISGSKMISLTNGRKRAVPTIETSASMTISFSGYSWTVDAGRFILPELELTQGTNTVTVNGNGTISFTWQEGEL